jgi:predicted amidohydrolase YtcJ
LFAATKHCATTGHRLPSLIPHTELVADEDIPCFKKLNVIANFEPLWALEDGMLLSCLSAATGRLARQTR